MTQGFWLDSVSPNGLYQCIVEAADQTVWMYLHDRRTQDVISDSPICSLVPTISLAEFQKNYKRGDTPPLVEEYSTEQAVVADLTGLVLKWAEDQISAVALLKVEPRTLLVAHERKGYSKAVRMDTRPWGHPWDETKYREKFVMPS